MYSGAPFFVLPIEPWLLETLLSLLQLAGLHVRQESLGHLQGATTLVRKHDVEESHFMFLANCWFCIAPVYPGVVEQDVDRLALVLRRQRIDCARSGRRAFRS